MSDVKPPSPDYDEIVGGRSVIPNLISMFMRANQVTYTEANTAAIQLLTQMSFGRVYEVTNRDGSVITVESLTGVRFRLTYTKGTKNDKSNKDTTEESE